MFAALSSASMICEITGRRKNARRRKLSTALEQEDGNVDGPHRRAEQSGESKKHLYLDRGGVMKFLNAIQRACSTPDFLTKIGQGAGKVFRAGACGLVAMVVSTGFATAADENPANWPVYHGNGKSSRFSALDSINKTNVKKLKVAWIHQPGEITGGLQATPIVIDGVLYYSSANNKVQALDAATGKELWRYQPKLDPIVNEIFFTASSRGVTVGLGKVYLATLDGRLIGLDQKSGKEVWQTQLVNRQAAMAVRHDQG
jgi:hypothetical protein